MSGTLRVKLPEIGIDILGIFAGKRPDGSYFFFLPVKYGIDAKTGQKVQYPIITFHDKEKRKALMETIREQGLAFIEKRLADQENPITFPKKKINEPKLDRQSKPLENSTDAKQKASIAKPKSAAPKVWSDLPKKKICLSKAFSK